MASKSWRQIMCLVEEKGAWSIHFLQVDLNSAPFTLSLRIVLIMLSSWSSSPEALLLELFSWGSLSMCTPTSIYLMLSLLDHYFQSWRCSAERWPGLVPSAHPCSASGHQIDVILFLSLHLHQKIKDLTERALLEKLVGKTPVRLNTNTQWNYYSTVTKWWSVEPAGDVLHCTTQLFTHTHVCKSPTGLNMWCYWVSQKKIPIVLTWAQWLQDAGPPLYTLESQNIEL